MQAKNAKKVRNFYKKNRNDFLSTLLKKFFKKESKAALADFISAMIGRTVKQVRLTANEPPVDLLGQAQMAFDVAVTFDDGERAAIEMQGLNRDYEWKSRKE